MQQAPVLSSDDAPARRPAAYAGSYVNKRRRRLNIDLLVTVLWEIFGGTSKNRRRKVDMRVELKIDLDAVDLR